MPDMSFLECIIVAYLVIAFIKFMLVVPDMFTVACVVRRRVPGADTSSMPSVLCSTVIIALLVSLCLWTRLLYAERLRFFTTYSKYRTIRDTLYGIRQ